MILKKVILVTSTFSHEKKGGVPTYVENRAYYLSKKLDVIIFGLGDSKVFNNICFQSIGKSSNFRFLFWLYWIKLICYILINRKAIIEIHNIPISFPLFFICKCRYFFHGPARYESKFEDKSIYFQYLNYFIEKICVILAYKIFVVSNNYKKIFINEHPFVKKNITVKLPKYKFYHYYFNEYRIINKNLNFIIIRRLVKRTGVVPFVKLFFKMLENKIISSNCHLIIAGDGPERKKLVDIITKSGFKKNIEYLGLISEQKKIELFQRSDFNIVPTLALEGFGLVVIEAGICGCQSIVSNINALPEVIGYLQNNGIIYDLTEQSCFNTFKSLKKNMYNRKTLSSITKNMFYFDFC